MAEHEQKQLSREERLNEWIAEYVRRVDEGEQVDPDEFAAQHPDLAHSFRQYLNDAALLSQFRNPPARQTPAAPSNVETAKSYANQETLPPSGVPAGQLGQTEIRQFGRYRIVGALGIGGMGAVYLAEDPQLERQVALKIPTLHGDNDPQSLQRFYQEARLAATLSHPNICPVYDIGEQDGTPFIAMAYIKGQPLSRLVGGRQLRSQRAIVVLLRKIALALAEAHAQGVVHRDMKPSNILVDKRGEPIVTDFGLAQRISKPGEERLTKSGMLLGTPSYMAPEQVQGDLERIGPRSDIYSLGVILYEMLTGQCPFVGPITAILAQILRDEPRPPSELESTVDPRLEAICLKMMAKSPDDRYGSATEVAQELAKLIAKGAAGTKAAQATDQAAAEREAQRHRIAALLRSGQFAAAIAALEQMAQLQDAGSEPYVAWAEQELTRVRAIPQPIRDRGPQLVETAIELLASQQYAEAVRLLSAWPAEYRSPEATKLLDKATRLEQEAGQLNARIAQAVSEGSYDGLRAVLERLLELEPGNLTARDLFETLATYGPGQTHRVDAQGRLLPAQPESLLTLADRVLRGGLLGWARRQKYGQHPRRGSGATTAGSSGPDLPILPIALGLGGAAIVLLVIVIFLRDGRYEVRVELDQRLLADSSVTLHVDGKEMEISGLGDTIKLKPGPHGYELRRGDTVVRSGSFSVVQGDNEPLRISMEQVAVSEAIAQPSRVDGLDPPSAAGPLPTPDVQRIVLDPSCEVYRLHGPSQQIDELCCTNDAVFASDHGSVFRFSLVDGTELPRITSGGRTNGLAIDETGSRIAIAKDATVEFWDARTREMTSRVDLGREDGFVACIAANRTFEIFAAGFVGFQTDEGRQRWGYLIDRKQETAEELFPIDVPPESGFSTTVEFGSAPDRFFVSDMYHGEERMIYAIDPIRRQYTRGAVPGAGKGTGTIAPLHRDAQIISGSWNGENRIIDTRSWQVVGRFRAEDHRCDWHVFTSPNGQFIATGGGEDESADRIIIRRASDFREIYEIPTVGIAVRHIDFTPDAKYIVFAGDATKAEGPASAYAIRVWRLPIGESPSSINTAKPPTDKSASVNQPLRSAKAPPLAVAPFSPDAAKQHQQAWAEYLGVPVEITNSIGMKFVLIPPGEFDMGSTEAEVAKLLEEAQTTNPSSWYIERLPLEAPKHRVRITNPFWLGGHEVTRGQFRRFVDDSGYQTEAERDGKGGYGVVDGGWKQNPRFVWNADLGFEQADDHPVVNVSWNDVSAFCEWLSKKEGESSRLPTEAQWEFACRAGATTSWYCGDDAVTLREHAWLSANSAQMSNPIGQLQPNAWGLYDMHGNVWEWCQDLYGENYYASSPLEDPMDTAGGWRRVYRGGSWYHDASSCRSSNRSGGDPGYRADVLGFRVACTVDATKP